MKQDDFGQSILGGDVLPVGEARWPKRRPKRWMRRRMVCVAVAMALCGCNGMRVNSVVAARMAKDKVVEETIVDESEVAEERVQGSVEKSGADGGRFHGGMKKGKTIKGRGRLSPETVDILKREAALDSRSDLSKVQVQRMDETSEVLPGVGDASGVGSGVEMFSEEQQTSAPIGAISPTSYQPVLYQHGVTTSNPSLWPDDNEGSSFIRDHRAFRKHDIITVMINESSEGKKKADTEAKTETSVVAGIAKFFGIEIKKWEANNTGLDPASLIDASTTTDFKGEGTTNRSGKMMAQLSAIVTEVQPNGNIRIEGKKSVVLNDEEEVIVITGLVRPMDINGYNQVQSNRIAELKIEFYGKGVLGQEQSPGWGYNLFRSIWPF